MRARSKILRCLSLAALAVGAAACAPAIGQLAAQPLPGTPPTERIVLLGDSLVHRSSEDHGLLAGIREDLERRHPDRRFELVDAGVDGNQIADIRGRLERDVLLRRPAAVVLYWDSDVSDVDESRMMPSQVRDRRAAYERDLVDVLQRLCSSGAHVIVSGPTLIGEQPHGQNPKDAQLDGYRALNRRVAARFDVRYVDTRRAFFRRRPRLLTEDGEHLNERGTTVVRTLFVRALDAWLRGDGVHPRPAGLEAPGAEAVLPRRDVYDTLRIPGAR
jgi:lysophospholipase L1-like esterase